MIDGIRYACIILAKQLILILKEEECALLRLAAHFVIALEVLRRHEECVR